MKTIFTGLILALAFQAQAQQTPAPAAATTAPTQTTSLSAQEAKPAAASKFGSNIIFQARTNVGDLKANGSEAIIDSVNGVGITYKATDKIKVEARHNFGLRNVSDSQIKNEQLADADVMAYTDKFNSDNGSESKYKTLDPTLHLNYSSDLKLFGSNAIVLLNRYYVPVTEKSIDAKSNGNLRSETQINWELNPKVTLSTYARLQIYLNKETADSNSQLRYMIGPVATYNFSDKINAYYLPYLDLVASTAQFRNFQKADKRNNFSQEIGANFTVGSVTINPAWSTTASRAEGSEAYTGAGSDANSEYDLNVIASF